MLDVIEPWIPRDLLEKLILTPTGVGLVMITAGAFMKQFHIPPRLVYPTDPRGDQIPGPPVTVPGSSGIDLLIWTITLPVSVRQAEDFWNWLKGAFSSGLGNVANSVSPIFGPMTMLVANAMPSFDTSTATGEPLVVKIYLSDILVAAGAGMLGASGVSQLSGLIPKV